MAFLKETGFEFTEKEMKEAGRKQTDSDIEKVVVEV